MTTTTLAVLVPLLPFLGAVAGLLLGRTAPGFVRPLAVLPALAAAVLPRSSRTPGRGQGDRRLDPAHPHGLGPRRPRPAPRRLRGSRRRPGRDRRDLRAALLDGLPARRPALPLVRRPGLPLHLRDAARRLLRRPDGAAGRLGDHGHLLVLPRRPLLGDARGPRRLPQGLPGHQARRRPLPLRPVRTRRRRRYVPDHRHPGRRRERRPRPPDADRPAAPRRCGGQVGPVPAAHLAARRDGGPHARLRADPRRHDGRRRRVLRGPPPPRLRRLRRRPDRPRRDGRGHDGRLGPRRPGPGRHQARPRLLDDRPARLHDRGPGRRRPRRRRLPPPVPRRLQGAPLPRRRRDHPRSRHELPRRHVAHERAAQAHPGRVLDDDDRARRPRRHPSLRRLLLQGSRPRSRRTRLTRRHHGRPHRRGLDRARRRPAHRPPHRGVRDPPVALGLPRPRPRRPGARQAAARHERRPVGPGRPLPGLRPRRHLPRRLVRRPRPHPDRHHGGPRHRRGPGRRTGHVRRLAPHHGHGRPPPRSAPSPPIRRTAQRPPRRKPSPPFPKLSTPFEQGIPHSPPTATSRRPPTPPTPAGSSWARCTATQRPASTSTPSTTPSSYGPPWQAPNWSASWTARSSRRTYAERAPFRACSARASAEPRPATCRPTSAHCSPVPSSWRSPPSSSPPSEREP